MELVTLTTKELRRLEVLQALANRTVRQAEAACLLDLSIRQIKRLYRRYRAAGAAGVASSRRGKRPNNALSDERKAEIMALYQERYSDFGPTLAMEKLHETHGVQISRETLRKLLIAAQLWKPARRRARPRPPRERRACFGELVQIDGSPHAWFENRAPRCTLVVAIDDATSHIGAARFVKAETTNAYFELFEQYFAAHGLPEAFYSDRHSIFRISNTMVSAHQTQVARALNELDVELICANSPQAKGRVERVNRILQDRLVKELRLQKISTLNEANDFLPSFLQRHNAKFAKAPRLDFNAHRTAQPFDLSRILCQCFDRKLSVNLTVQLDNNIYAISQLRSTKQLRAGMNVKIRMLRDHSLQFFHDQQPLEYRLLHRIERNPAILSAKELAERPAKTASMPTMARTPKANHPWRTYSTKLPHAWGAISELPTGDVSALR